MPTSFILEPVGRSTAPAAASRLHMAATHGECAVLLMQTANHLVRDQFAFAQATARADALGRHGWLVTFVTQPEGPETGCGYVEANRAGRKGGAGSSASSSSTQPRSRARRRSRSTMR